MTNTPDDHAGRWLPDSGEGTSLTRNLTVHVPARHLTDPATARLLVEHFGVEEEFFRGKGLTSMERFVSDLRIAVASYADELEHAHDEIVRHFGGAS
jgi:hypothetical protein